MVSCQLGRTHTHTHTCRRLLVPAVDSCLRSRHKCMCKVLVNAVSKCSRSSSCICRVVKFPHLVDLRSFEVNSSGWVFFFKDDHFSVLFFIFSDSFLSSSPVSLIQSPQGKCLFSSAAACCHLCPAARCSSSRGAAPPLPSCSHLS